MTVKETFEAMAGRFRPERAQGLKAVIQYDITGRRAAPTTSTSRTGSAPSGRAAPRSPPSRSR